jgi:hypothetical protein
MNTKTMRIALHIALVAVAKSAGLPDEALLARGKLGLVTKKETADAVFVDDGSLEALWVREAELAQLETARFLSPKFSMPPTHSPVKAPVKPPTPPPTPLETPQPTTAHPTTVPSSTPISAGDSAEPSQGPNTPLPTVDPCLMGRTVEEYMLEALSPITAPALLQNPSTPQGMAFAFMINDPLVQGNLCTYATLQQRYGLATFYYSTRGDMWSVRTAWLTETNECAWFGVICNDDVRTTNLTLGEFSKMSCRIQYYPCSCVCRSPSLMNEQV